MALQRCQFPSASTTAESSNSNQLLGGRFSVGSGRDESLHCCSLSVPELGCSLLHIFIAGSTLVWDLSLRYPPGNSTQVALDSAWLWQQAGTPVLIHGSFQEQQEEVVDTLSSLQLGTAREKLNQPIGFTFGFSQWKNWTISNDSSSFPKTFSFQQ